MTTDDIRERVRGQVARICQAAPRDDDDIFEMGLLSSLYALRLVQAIEREFSFDVPDEELRVASFRSVDAISAMVTRVREAR